MKEKLEKMIIEFDEELNNINKEFYKVDNHKDLKSCEGLYASFKDSLEIFEKMKKLEAQKEVVIKLLSEWED